jgi:preprotein translocase subunit SecG
MYYKNTFNVKSNDTFLTIYILILIYIFCINLVKFKYSTMIKHCQRKLLVSALVE